MKSVTIIALISTVVSLASANFIEKTLLCQEVCWMHDVDNLEACKDRCMRDPRPTEAEAGYCQSCIDNCGVYLYERRNVVLYAECRRGCFQKYFPQHMPLTAMPRPHKRKESVHLDGIPPTINKSLGGKTYPVENTICDLSCRNKGADSIMAKEGEMDSCVTSCLSKPTQHEQELQMSLDCRDKCSEGTTAADCVEGCVRHTAKQRAPNVNFDEKVLDSAAKDDFELHVVLSTATDGSVVTITGSAAAPTGNDTFMLKNKPAAGEFRSTMVIDADFEAEATSTAEASATPSFSGKKNKTKHIIGQKESSATKPYLESFLFWTSAVVTLSFAAVIGLQVI